MQKRTLTTIGLIILISCAPFWVYLSALALATILIPFYFEAIILAFLIDVLYGAHIHTTISFVFPFAIIFCILVMFSLPIRERLRVGY